MPMPSFCTGWLDEQQTTHIHVLRNWYFAEFFSVSLLFFCFVNVYFQSVDFEKAHENTHIISTPEQIDRIYNAFFPHHFACAVSELAFTTIIEFSIVK